MSVELKLKENQKLLFDSAKNFDLSHGKVAKLDTEDWREFCIEKRSDLSFYEQNWVNFFVKDQAGVNRKMINNQEMSDILSDKNILNVFYFEVWGSVLEHKDPCGEIYSYPENEYKTLLMPISIPSDNFQTFYNRKPVNLQEGKFYQWDVSNIPHSWTFDYTGGKFKLLHIDYIE